MLQRWFAGHWWKKCIAIITVDNLSVKQVQYSLLAEWKGRRVEPKKTTAKSRGLLSNLFPFRWILFWRRFRSLTVRDMSVEIGTEGRAIPFLRIHKSDFLFSVVYPVWLTQLLHSCFLWAIIYSPGRSAYSAAGKKGGPHVGIFLDRSQTHACGSWVWEAARNPFSGNK